MLLPGLEPAYPGMPTVLTRVPCLFPKPVKDREVRNHPDSRISAKVQSWELGLSRVLRPEDHRNRLELQHVSSLHYRLRHQSWFFAYYQCCGSGMFVPDPRSEFSILFPGSRVKNIPDPDPQQRIWVFLTQKLFQSSRKYDPGCLSGPRVSDPNQSIPDPGFLGKIGTTCTGSRIRNNANYFWTPVFKNNKSHKKSRLEGPGSVQIITYPDPGGPETSGTLPPSHLILVKRVDLQPHVQVTWIHEWKCLQPRIHPPPLLSLCSYIYCREDKCHPRDCRK